MEKDRKIGFAGLAMLAASVAICSFAACRASGGQGVSAHARPATDPSPSELVQQYGGRPPRPCPAITHKPSDAEAAILAQCTMEGPFGDTETLLTDVQVHITGSRQFSKNSAGVYTGSDNNRKDIDNRADVLTLVGYAKNYACGVQSFSPGKNCTMVEMPDSPGACWKTNYGEYRCNFVNVGVGYHPFVPPPTAY
jgi:hypothetical protein